jgi:predicted ArsR family transcriptional regulator
LKYQNRDTPFYTTITRTVEVGKAPPKKGLYSAYKERGVSKADAILEFCNTPRSGREIIEFLGLEYRQWSRMKYIKPLLDGGKLKLMLPQYEPNRNQRYVNAEVEIAIPTDDAIIEYCTIPRRKKEIREHFGLKVFQVKSHVDPLIADGRLKMTDPNNPQNYWQRYVSAGEGAPITDEEIILDFCREARTRTEISERLGVHIDKMHSYTQPLVDSGKLKMTNFAVPTSRYQKFITTV